MDEAFRWAAGVWKKAYVRYNTKTKQCIVGEMRDQYYIVWGVGVSWQKAVEEAKKRIDNSLGYLAVEQI